MKVFLILTGLILMVPESHAFFPKMACWEKFGGSDQKGIQKTPMTVEYLDDGMIEVSYKGKSCELDWVEYHGRKYKGWVRFANNNLEIDGKFLNTRCKPMINDFLNTAGLESTDIEWLTLSDIIIDQEKRQQELKKKYPKFPAQLGIFNTHDPGAGPVVKIPLNCRPALF